MTRAESTDIARAHACAMRDLSAILIAKIERGKYDEGPNLLTLIRKRAEMVETALPKAVSMRGEPWPYQRKGRKQ